MCFSATASFTAAGILTVTGAVTLLMAIDRGSSTGERLLATFPLVFRIQQASQGLAWLGIAGSLPHWLYTRANAVFISTAYTFWEVAEPIVGWSLESRRWRKTVFVILIVAGATIAAHLSYGVVTCPVSPMEGPDWGGHIWYATEFVSLPFIELVYFVTACAALLLSSNRSAFWFGVALAGALVFTFAVYQLKVLASVWRFFPAIGSLLIVVGFQRRPTPRFNV